MGKNGHSVEWLKPTCLHSRNLLDECVHAAASHMHMKQFMRLTFSASSALISSSSRIRPFLRLRIFLLSSSSSSSFFASVRVRSSADDVAPLAWPFAGLPFEAVGSPFVSGCVAGLGGAVGLEGLASG